MRPAHGVHKADDTVDAPQLLLHSFSKTLLSFLRLKASSDTVSYLIDF